MKLSLSINHQSKLSNQIVLTHCEIKFFILVSIKIILFDDNSELNHEKGPSDDLDCLPSVNA